MPLTLRCYGAAARLAQPGLRLWLARRVARGREDAARLAERFGAASRERPPGRLIWVHAASVGETVSVLPLIAELAREGAVLLTTGTLTSAALAAERLPAGAIHQFVPLDVPDWVEAFLDHWRPAAAAFVESEIWPNMLAALARRGIPAMLVNGRISARSGARWRLMPDAARELLGRFRWIAAQSPQDAARFRSLGAARVENPGNLKFAAPALPDAEGRAALAALLPGPRVLAAATHPGEEEHVIAAHRRLLREFPGLATIIVPRHPARGAAVAALASGLSAAMRSGGQEPEPGGIYIADTLGELGLFYRLCPIAFIGGSLVPIGGHNMLEAARLGCAVLTGPHTENFAEAVAVLRGADALEIVPEGGALGPVLRRLLADPARAAAMGEAGRAAADRYNDLPGRLARRILESAA
ncbi:MAG TPA: 3-deoxy-D-manno-octulosonic acid transferase [Acetobacteraceae bacterium]|nr:3-deoxy-D-manno-octulosonic acid transferase [Acetobacteraceae bacterium]